MQIAQNMLLAFYAVGVHKVAADGDKVNIIVFICYVNGDFKVLCNLIYAVVYGILGFKNRQLSVFIL